MRKHKQLNEPVWTMFKYSPTHSLYFIYQLRLFTASDGYSHLEHVLANSVLSVYGE